MITDDDDATAAKLATCLDEEQTALMNCDRIRQGMMGDIEKGIGHAPGVEQELAMWENRARLAQVRGRLVEIRGY